MTFDNPQKETCIGMSLEDYIREANETSFEIINGKRIDKMPPKSLHLWILRAVFRLLDAFVTLKAVWLIDPNRRKAWVYTPDDDSPKVFLAEGILREETLLPNFKLELAKIWV